MQVSPIPAYLLYPTSPHQMVATVTARPPAATPPFSPTIPLPIRLDSAVQDLRAVQNLSEYSLAPRKVLLPTTISAIANEIRKTKNMITLNELFNNAVRLFNSFPSDEEHFCPAFAIKERSDFFNMCIQENLFNAAIIIVKEFKCPIQEGLTYFLQMILFLKERSRIQPTIVNNFEEFNSLLCRQIHQYFMKQLPEHDKFLPGRDMNLMVQFIQNPLEEYRSSNLPGVGCYIARAYLNAIRIKYADKTELQIILPLYQTLLFEQLGIDLKCDLSRIVYPHKPWIEDNLLF